MATHTVSFLPTSLSQSRFLEEKSYHSHILLPSTSFHGDKLLLKSSNFVKFSFKCHSSSVSTVFSSLPTKKFVSEKIPKWSARGIRSFGLGELEARKLKYPNTGTEALLMGILIEGTSPAAKFLRENGITFFKVRDEIVNLLGKSDLFFFSPEHPPLTEQAQRVLDRAVEEKMKSGDDGELTTTHIVLAIWSEIESAGHKILANLGFNDEKARELAKSMNADIALNFR